MFGDRSMLSVPRQRHRSVTLAADAPPSRKRQAGERSIKSVWGTLTFVAVVLSSIALAYVWAVRLPFLEQHDENAHADYAFTIFTTRGHLPRDARVPSTDVHPSIRYLELVGGFPSMRRNLDGRAPAGYGSREFLRKADEGAPQVRPDFLEHNARRIPYVERFYSYFYYALDAVAIWIGATLSHGSVTTEFLFARLLGAALMSCSLLLSYGTLLELRMRKVPALALVATIGLFPLTSWMSASVQPDNLSFTAVALVFYLSVRLRRESCGLQGAAYMGLALGLLALTKSQYFIAIGIPALIDRSLRFADRRPTSAAWIAYCGLLLGPMIVAAGSVEAFVNGADHQVAALATIGGHPASNAAQKGFIPLCVWLMTSLVRAWTSFFYHGFTFFGYWGEFSWSRIQISFGSDLATRTVFSILGGFSILVSLLMMLRLIKTVLPGLAQVCRSRGWRSATRLATSNVILNSYFLFLAIMLVINISTNGEVADEGRYWLPLILPSLLCATVYAPRALHHRFRGPAALAFATGLLAYSIVSAPAALATLRQHFYEPAVTQDSEEMFATFQQVGHYRIDRDRPKEILAIKCCTAVVRGIAIDSRSDLPARYVDLVVDGKPRARALVDLNEPQVARELLDDSLLRSGFEAHLDLHGIASGVHELRLGIGERGRLRSYLSIRRLRFTVEKNNRSAS
jgi:hypothetical protein